MKYSIIITTYNTEKFVKDSIYSVLNQSYDDLELVVIDDGSSDNTYKLLQEISKEDNRCRVFRIKHSGAGFAKNYGLEKAKGQYISFLDSDDTLDINTLEICNKHIDNLDLFIFGINFVRYQNMKLTSKEEWKPIPNIFSNGNELASWYIKHHRIMLYSCGNKIYRKSILDKNNIEYDKDCHWGEDRLFNYKYLQACGKIRSIDTCLYNYRQINSSSLTHKFLSHHIDTVLYLHKAKMDYLLPLATYATEEEKKEFMLYDVRKEVARAFIHIAEHVDHLTNEQFNEEINYLNNKDIPQYFYIDKSKIKLIDWINNQAFTDGVSTNGLNENNWYKSLDGVTSIFTKLKYI